MLSPSQKIEFGDFQTPYTLAIECCKAVSKLFPNPSSLFEPTCGLGNFLAAGQTIFCDAASLLGSEINPQHAASARERFAEDARVRIQNADFFGQDWKFQLAKLPRPLLILGNPPWVTNSALGLLESCNLPRKRNLDSLSGIDARTGKSNFDVSEWMLFETAKILDGDRGALAVLCKTSVARKLLLRVWRDKMRISHANIFPVDAKLHFDVAVSACLLVVRFDPAAFSQTAILHQSLSDDAVVQTIGFTDDMLIADPEVYAASRHLAGSGGMRWRSGIKHDASSVMELERVGSRLKNGLGDEVDIEDDYIFPLFKSSDIFNGTKENRLFMLVPQKETGAAPADLRLLAPRTWEYLLHHRNRMSERRSSIYKKRPEFSIFGVGDYTFLPWKVAISGLYKGLRFRLVPPIDGKPVVFDDTVYFISFESGADAQTALDFLQTPQVEAFLSSQLFWDAKRPVTAEMLNRLYVPLPTSSMAISSGAQGNLFQLSQRAN